MTKHPPRQAVSVRIEVTELRAVARPSGLPTLVEFAPGQRFALSTGPNEFALQPGRYDVQLWSQSITAVPRVSNLGSDPERPRTP